MTKKLDLHSNLFRCAIAGCCSLLLVFSAAIGRADDAANSKSPLADLPSKGGPHLEKIENLGDDSWLNLGMPEPDPKWGRAYGRGYYTTMAYAPNLGGAFYYGEGEHGYWNKKTRRYGDDLWFYDLRAHRWICCYPGTHVDKVEMKLNDWGWEVSSEGEPVPIAALVHGYELSTFVPYLNKFMFMPRPGGYWQHSPLLERRKSWSNPKGKNVYTGEPRYWNVETGKWERERVKGVPVIPHVCYALIHLIGRKKTLMYNRKRGLWLYDHPTQTWEDPKPTGEPPQSRDYEGISCYDTKGERAFFFNRKEAVVPRVYDAAKNRWLTPGNDNTPIVALGPENEDTYEIVPSTQFANATFDDANGVVLYFQHRVGRGSDDGRNMSRRKFYVYDPAEGRWSEPKEFPEGFLQPHQRINAFYDSELNVHVLNRGYTDSSVKGEIWVYRYKK